MEYNYEMENKNIRKSERQPLSSNQHNHMISSDFESPKFDLIDFDMLLDRPNNTIGKAGEIEIGSAEDSDYGYVKKRKHIQEKDVSFLELLDDIFLHDKSMEMVNSPLERIEELLHYRLAGSPEKKRRKIETEDESFAKPKTYCCHYCPKIFYSNVLCHDHQVRHIKVLLKCSWCSKQCRSNGGLKRHIQYYHRHSSMCQVFFDSQ